MTLSILADEGNWMIPGKLAPLLLEVALLGACTQMGTGSMQPRPGFVSPGIQYSGFYV